MTRIIDLIPWKLILGLLVFSLLIIWGTAHNEQLYQQPIFKVTAVQNGPRQKQMDNFNNVDYQQNQRLSGYITNGHHRSQKMVIQNQSSDSAAMDHHYRVGEEAFVILHRHSSATIKDYKRDVPLVALVMLTIVLLLTFLKLSGLTALLSIIVNALVFGIAVVINGQTQGTQVLSLFAGLVLVFSALTLVLILGFTRQTLATFLSTVMGTGLALLIALIVFMLTHERGVYYESMQYVTQLPRPLFLAETMIGSLGAVMDESTDIISSLFTLKQERPQITRWQIFRSGRQIGRTIMGPLINVLFFIFMGETLAMTLLFLKNGNSWGYSFSMNMSLGMVQSLISGIGIVLAIPLASFFAGILMKGARH